MSGTRPPSRAAVEDALRGRLLAVRHVLAPESDSETATPNLLHALARAVQDAPAPDRVWLLASAIVGAFPTPGQVAGFRRRLDLAAPGAAMFAALTATIDRASATQGAMRRLELVERSVIVDVAFCASHEHNTGIQRVVRETMPKWRDAGHPMRFVTWTDDASSFRDLSEVEADRVLNWHDREYPSGHDKRHGPSESGDTSIATMVIPWRSHVFLPEVPAFELCEPLAAIAEFSGNSVSLIGYDAIPLVSAEGQRAEESERFAHYLTVVKHADRVLAISESAAEEFRGFVDALGAQGLQGPDVVAVPLAVEVPQRAVALERRTGERPLVLCVGSHEPRKNQEAILSAAELLHREGLDFELVFVGGGSRGATAAFDARVGRLRRAGFAVRSMRGLPDVELWALFKRARCSAFVSLHEGFGLPVAESLALGVPVLTSNFGSLAEIAAMGGCVTVDPRDDDAIVDGLRRLLTDDELIERLRAEAATAPPRTWSQYADDLWSRAGLGIGAAS
jgi:glycosyltransferase involved in cell wall biosynthesis